MNPDGDISLNIFETINPTRISIRGKFIIVSQVKLLVSNTFWQKLILTELFDHNSWILNPDGYISLNIFETINPTIISNRGKFMIISQAKLLVPSTFWLKLIFTELFDTTRGF